MISLCRNSVAPEEAYAGGYGGGDDDVGVGGRADDTEPDPTFVLYQSSALVALVPEGGSDDAPSLVVRRTGGGLVLILAKNEAEKGKKNTKLEIHTVMMMPNTRKSTAVVRHPMMMHASRYILPFLHKTYNTYPT